MNIAEIIKSLVDANIKLYVENGKLNVKAPKGAMTPQMLNAIKERKAEIIALLGSGSANTMQIPVVDRIVDLPLSYSQRRLWLLDQIEGGSAHYNIPSALRLRGRLDRTALQAAFCAIIERHEVLRTHYMANTLGDPVQCILDAGKANGMFLLPVSDLSALGDEERWQNLREAMHEEHERPFDLANDLMLRARLFALGQDDHVLLITAHHIASDGWSTSILIKELCAIYQNGILGSDKKLPALPIQYADYAHWQQEREHGEELARQLEYWEDQLADLPAVHQLPLDYGRPSIHSFAGSAYEHRISREKIDALQELCKRIGGTLFMGLHAVFSAMLSRCSNESDIVIGTPIANRQQEQVGGLIGFFVNTLVLRSDVSQDIRFLELLQQSRDMLLSAYDHQEVPFEQLVERLQPARVLGHSPLFQVMLVMQNNEVAEFDLQGLILERVEQEPNHAKFDLTLAMSESVEGLTLSWEYSTDLWRRETIENMAGRFERLLDAMLTDVSTKVMEVELLSAVEHRRLVDMQTRTSKPFDDGRCLHDLVETQVALEPGRPALISDECVLSYGELNARANRLAHYLLETSCVTRGDLVAICLERSHEVFVAILAVLKAGAGYLPMDPDYPKARLDYVIGDAKPKTVISSAAILARLEMDTASTVSIDSPTIREAIARQSADNPLRETIGGESEDLAYVIYTSGSTGAPKGSMLSHRSLCNLSAAQLAHFDVTCESRILQFASIAFDAATWEIAMAWPHGAALVLLDSENAKLPQKVSETVHRFGVTHATLPPVLLPMLDEHLWQSVATLIVAGEACALPIAEKWAHGRRFFNAYGPSETTVCATIGQYVSGQRVMHIGKPIQNVQVYVLNGAGRLAPEGTPGELYIGGVGLSRGYLNREDLTNARFVINPYCENGERWSSEKLYRTGDLVRWLSDGNLEFLGRIDHQIKIRGFRVELGEIESVLSGQEGVHDVLVLAKGEGADKRLIAYIVGTVETEESTRAEFTERLRVELSKAMPEYMMPSAFIVLESFPSTVNGKVDRKAMLEMEEQQSAPSYHAPQSEHEKFLCALAEEVLGAGRMGVSDNFFHRGGHSLSATKYISRINQHYQTGIPIRALFQAQTVRELAHIVELAACERKIPPIEVVGRAGRMPLSYGQQRLWMLDQIDGGSAHYNMPAALKLTGNVKESALERALQELVERHESLRTRIVVGEDGRPFACIDQARALILSVTDLSAQMPGERQVSVTRITAEEAGQAFDLQNDLMLRAQLLKLDAQEYILLITMHHIASDGWSMAILINEMSALYKAQVDCRPSLLTPLAIQYVDYAHWQRKWLQGDVLAQHHSYWEGQLRGLPLIHGLPLDHVRPKIQTFNGALHRSLIEEGTLQMLQSQCYAHGATLFMGLHAAFSVLLSRYSNERDIVIGTPIANRERAEIAGLIGFFTNTLVLRADLTGSPSYATLLEQSKRTLLDAYTYQQLPFEHIVEQLQPERSLSHSPLFQILLVLQNNDEGELDLPGLTLSPVDAGNTVAKYDLTLTVAESGGRLELGWEYNADLFEPETISRMAEHFGILLDSFCNQPDGSVFATSMLTCDEERKIVDAVAYRPNLQFSQDCIHTRFERHAQQTPDSVALYSDDEELSYGELNRQANRLARKIRQSDRIGPDSLVGICMHRSPDMVVAILAVLKAGAAYVPLDPEYPENRLQYMMEDANLGIVLAQSRVCDRLGSATAEILCVDDAEFENSLERLSDENLCLEESGVRHDSIAYVIYTSGSTGAPKGVMVEHHNVTRLFDSCDLVYKFSQSDVWTMFHSYAFDFSVWEIWGALCYGGQLVVVPYWVSRSPQDFRELLAQRGVTVLSQTPSAFSNLVQADKASHTELALRYVVFGGEALNIASLSPWIEKYGDASPQLINMYGITETTVHVTHRRLDRAAILHGDGRSVIGEPLADLDIVILNAEQALVPDGITGEMYVGGAGLARGYLNKPALTAERFVELRQFPGRRFYRTGDIAQRLSDSDICYLGRMDHQVKIRGFRIELGEIEATLGRHEHIKDALVIARSMQGREKQLVAYLVPAKEVHSVADDETASFVSAVRSYLETELAKHMIPSDFVIMESFPLTSNGKIDRAKLPEAQANRVRKSLILPRTYTEAIVADSWQKALRIDQICMNDNFFQIGGHSLLAIQVISDLKHQGYRIDVRELFTTDSLADFARAIENRRGDEKSEYHVPPNLVPGGCTRILPEMLPLIQLTQEELDRIAQCIPGGYGNIQDIYPLAPLQEGILFHHRMSQGADPYVTPMLIRARSRRHVDELLEGLQFVLGRYDVLRTAFMWEGLSTAVQVVCRKADIPVTWIELPPGKDAMAEMNELSKPERQWMDLTVAPLLRATVGIGAGDAAYYVLLQLHHLIDDATSLAVMQREIASYVTGETNALPVPGAYREFVARALHQTRSNDAAAFFRGKLGDIEEPTLPFGLTDTIGDMSKISEAQMDVPQTLADRIRRICSDLKLGPATFFHSAWAMVIASTAGKNDVVFGSVLSGRLQGMRGSESMMGMFINTLPLRVNLDGHNAKTFTLHVNNSLMELLEHEQAPLSVAQRCSAIPGGSPLFSSILNFRHGTASLAQNAAEEFDSGYEYIGGQERTNYPFDMSVTDVGQGFEINAQIDGAIGATRVVGYMMVACNWLADALDAGDDGMVSEVSILPEAELETQLQRWNPQEIAVPKNTNIYEAFAAQVARRPNALALHGGGQRMSYSELDMRASRLAEELTRKHGIRRGEIVGICLHRSLDMIVAILGVLKAGAAYLPLDASYPVERLQYMVEDARAQSVISTREAFSVMPQFGATAIHLYEEMMLTQEVDTNQRTPASEEGSSDAADMAYVIYTSGSTGKAKGVAVDQGSFLRHIDAWNGTLGMAESDVVFQFATINFDAAQEQIFSALLSGACVYVPSGITLAPTEFFSLCRESGVTILDVPPAYCRELLRDQAAKDFFGNSSVRTMIWGGEAPGKDLLQAWMDLACSIPVINAYGPTETIVTACAARLDATSLDAGTPIGQALPGRRAYVVNNGKLVPSGVVGELFIGGPCLARGYLHNEALTRERFVPDCFVRDQQDGISVMYKTGDLVKWREDGQLVFLGRTDDQVKIRGFRIELGEIEFAIRMHLAVKDAAVRAFKTLGGDTRLIAYVVLDDGDHDEMAPEERIRHLRSQLAGHLPEYMIPVACMVLQHLPYAASGKLDVKRLPVPDDAAATAQFAEPTTELECALAMIWKEILDIHQVGLRDNFFFLGGHSLSATRAVTAINQRYAITLPLKTFFLCETLSDCVVAVDNAIALCGNESLKTLTQVHAETEW